jgi:hypothetical protein
MTAFSWDQLFEQPEEQPDQAVQISASPGKWTASATTIIEEGTGKNRHLSFGPDIWMTLEMWALPLSTGPRMVLLVNPVPDGMEYRSLAWCRFPYRTDLLEVSRFVPGRNRDNAWRDNQLERAAAQPDPVMFLKRELINVTDSTNERDTALFGCPRQLHQNVLRDQIAGGDGKRRGPLDKRRFDKVVAMDDLWTLKGNHPDLVPRDSHAAQLAAEIRWAILPSLSPPRAPENDVGEPPDFALAKERVKCEQPILDLLDDVERGLLRFRGQVFPLHEAVKERASQLLDYAVERALCGPRDGNKLGADRRVSRFARTILTYELYNQNRRWYTWGGSISQPDSDLEASDRVPQVDPTEKYRELVEDLTYSRAGGVDDVGNDALIEQVNEMLEPDVSVDRIFLGCAALQVLLEDGVNLPRLARYVARLEELERRIDLPEWLRGIVGGVRLSAVAKLREQGVR